jgi:GNAT superfamily N-acetyltransferase
MILTKARRSGKVREQKSEVRGRRNGELQITCLRVATNRSIGYHRPMVRVRIRLARSGDCRALAKLRYRFRAEDESVTETESQFVRRCTSWMKKRFRADPCPWRCWVLDDGKRVLGHVCVQLFEKIPNPVNEPELHAYITNFYVIPEMRDQGLGKRLLNKALSWCRARGTDAVILWPSPASKSFYRQCGFVAPSDIFELRPGALQPPSRRQGASRTGINIRS